MPQRSFEHSFRGVPLAAAGASSASPARGYRGSLATPAFRTSAAHDASASGGLAAGGSPATGVASAASSSVVLAAGGSSRPGVSSAASSVGVLPAGGEASSTVATACGAGGGLGLSGSATASLGSRVEAWGGCSAGGLATPSVVLAAAASGGILAGGRAGRSARLAAAASGGWKTGGAALVVDPPSKADSFTYWFRGRSISNSLGDRSGGFAHAYRNARGLPSSVRGRGVAVLEVATGGLSSGGRAFVRSGLAAASSGGLGLSGTASILVGASLDASGGLALGGRPAAGLAISTLPSGGLALGGVAAASRTLVAPIDASGGLALGGRPVVRLSVAARPSGGLGLGGGSPLLVGVTIDAAGGLAIGGRPVAGLSISAASSGGLALGGAAEASRTIIAAPAGGLALGGAFAMPRIGYHIYANGGLGGPIDYSEPIAVVYETTWTSAPLPPGSSFRFAVRAFDAETGLQEENLDASAALILDAEGRDVTHTPPAPLGVRAIPLAGGRARVEWAVAGTTAARRATRFHVYVHPHGVATFGAPAIVVPAASARGDSFSAEIGGLAHGVTYGVSVRAANEHGEEANTRQVEVTADAAPPTQVDMLAAVPSAVVA